MDRPPENRPTDGDADAATRAFLTGVLVPAWLAAGLLDWICHRQTRIDCNAGAHESLTHLLMALEAGAGVTAGMFFEIDAGVIATMASCALAHEATVIWDVRYASSRRHISQAEDHTHSFLEVLPFVAVAFAAFANSGQARALVGAGSEAPRFAFRAQRTRPPVATLAAVAASAVLGLLPYVEELFRCLRVRPTIAPQPPRDGAEPPR